MVTDPEVQAVTLSLTPVIGDKYEPSADAILPASVE